MWAWWQLLQHYIVCSASRTHLLGGGLWQPEMDGRQRLPLSLPLSRSPRPPLRRADLCCSKPPDQVHRRPHRERAQGGAALPAERGGASEAISCVSHKSCKWQLAITPFFILSFFHFRSARRLRRSCIPLTACERAGRHAASSSLLPFPSPSLLRHPPWGGRAHTGMWPRHASPHRLGCSIYS